MTAKLRADPLYSGFTCKNPLHKHWVTLTHDYPYSLGELHGWLGDLNQYTLPQRTVGVGRNVETFDAVRPWAYPLLLPHKADGGSLETWRMACTGAAEQFTHEHHDPGIHDGYPPVRGSQHRSPLRGPAAARQGGPRSARLRPVPAYPGE